MKTTIKMILALALALTMICALGTAAFADTPITITKNPTNERHFAGESAMFIAGANNYDRIEWRFNAPNGGDFSLDAFIAQFPACSVKGQGTTTLVINDIQTGMDGWRAYCRFSLGNSYADTAAAVIGVSIPTAPVNNVPAYNTWDYVYYEPDYIIVDGARVYSDGTVVYDYCEPDYIIVDGARVYSDGTVVYDYCEPDYIDVDGARGYSDGTVVYDYYEPDYIDVDSARVYSDGTVVYDYYEPDYVTVNGARVYSDGSIVF